MYWPRNSLTTAQAPRVDIDTLTGGPLVDLY